MSSHLEGSNQHLKNLINETIIPNFDSDESMVGHFWALISYLLTCPVNYLEVGAIELECQTGE